MKVKIVGVVALVAILCLVFASVAMAVSQATIDAIIADAQDGTIDGNWTPAEIEAALSYIKNNPLTYQYSDIQGVLQDYLSGLSAPKPAVGQLAFTGAELLLILGAGAAGVGCLEVANDLAIVVDVLGLRERAVDDVAGRVRAAEHGCQGQHVDVGHDAVLVYERVGEPVGERCGR